MAFKMSFTDDSGVTHPESIWVATFQAVDHGYNAIHARVVFHGWANMAAMTGKKRPIGEKAYTLEGSKLAYWQLIGRPTVGGDSLLNEVATALEAHAVATQDVDDPTSVTTPKAKISFFAEATPVTLPACWVNTPPAG